MKSLKRFHLPVALVVVSIAFSSWGFLVHRTIHQLAVYELPRNMQPFFHKNLENLVTNAVRPDLRRDNDSLEASRHFIDLEMYNDAAKRMPLGWDQAVKQYSKDSLLKYGYVPYHIVYMKGKLTEAFKSRNKDSILFYAADIGHYIGDAHVPLHTTVNYDGQLTNQKGLHSLWESMIPEIELASYQLYSKHRAKYLRQPDKAIWKAIRSASLLVPGMLEQEREVSKQFTDAQKYRIQMRRGKESRSYTSEFAKAYAAALKNSINIQLLRATDLIADFWYTSWVDAGKPDLNGLVNSWSDKDETLLQQGLQAFKKNKLLSGGLLISRKAEPKSE